MFGVLSSSARNFWRNKFSREQIFASWRLIAKIAKNFCLAKISRYKLANYSLVPRPSPAPVFDRLQYADIILYGYRVRTRRLGPHCACVEWYGICITSYLRYTLCIFKFTVYLRDTHLIDGIVFMLIRSCLWSNG